MNLVMHRAVRVATVRPLKPARKAKPLEDTQTKSLGEHSEHLVLYKDSKSYNVSLEAE